MASIEVTLLWQCRTTHEVSGCDRGAVEEGKAGTAAERSGREKRVRPPSGRGGTNTGRHPPTACAVPHSSPADRAISRKTVTRRRSSTPPDDLKLRAGSVFGRIPEKYFDGVRDRSILILAGINGHETLPVTRSVFPDPKSQMPRASGARCQPPNLAAGFDLSASFQRAQHASCG
jgi:hypothetical protein